MGIFQDMKRELNLGNKDLAALLIMIMVGSAITGWLYEMGFYYINAGGHWVPRGHGMGPWLPIYGFGGLGILLCCWYVRKSPLKVFVISCLVTGLLELITGYVLYEFFGGLRLWDYNTEIWNWGNIGGFVCARSVLLFALAGIALMKWIVPQTANLIRSLGETRALTISSVIGAAYAADIVIGYLVKGL